MALDTDRLDEQLNKSVSVSVENFVISRLNKIYSLDSDIELIKAFIGEALEIQKNLNEVEHFNTFKEQTALYYESFEKIENLLDRYSDTLNHDAVEMKQIKWFLAANKQAVKGFEFILEGFYNSNRIEFLELLYFGIDLLVSVLEDSLYTKNDFYLSTNIAILIRDFIIDLPLFLEKKFSQFKDNDSDRNKFMFLQRAISRAVSSAEMMFLQKGNLNLVRRASIQELYPDRESYTYMETQGQLFELTLSKLAEKYRDMYVHFEDGRVLDYDEDEDRLIDRVLENNNYKDVFIEKVF